MTEDKQTKGERVQQWNGMLQCCVNTAEGFVELSA